ncbi:MAG: Asp/Glu racemase [Rhodospirillaceae bacterium]|nr:Asp/Glu racemase [Rhodospirillaceae bacterium]
MTVTFDAGPAPVAKIGLVCLDCDQVIESELRAFLPISGLSLLSTRIPLGGRGTPETLAAMEAHIPEVAKLILPDDDLDVFVFGCTSGSMTIGPERVEAAVHKARPGVPVTNPVSAATAALRHFGAKRIALLTPYSDEINAVVGRFIADQGFEIAARGSFKCDNGVEIGLVPPGAIYEAGVRMGRTDCDALFISCAGLRASSVVQRIEDEIGKPVVTSNQALAWDCLRLAEIAAPVPGFGRLLAER